MHEKNVQALCARSILYPTACMQPRIDWHAPTPHFLSRRLHACNHASILPRLNSCQGDCMHATTHPFSHASMLVKELAQLL
jgi:hypothetical protein